MDDGRLGRAIGGDAGLGLDASGRGGEDDGAALAAGPDGTHRRLQGEEDAVEVDREDAAPIGEAQIGNRAAGADARIDDSVSEIGEIGLGPELLVGDVADQHLSLAGQREGEIAQAILVDIGKDQLLRPAFGDSSRDRGADAGGGAGDKDDGVGEVGHSQSLRRKLT